jgi:hypothetical protein
MRNGSIRLATATASRNNENERAQGFQVAPPAPAWPLAAWAESEATSMEVVYEMATSRSIAI